MELSELELSECLDRLAAHEVGRIALTDDGWPVVFPVNYRLVDRDRHRWIALRTRSGGAIDHPGARVALEIDGVDPLHHEGWSVLVRGTLQAVDEEAADFRNRFDPNPWAGARGAWLVIESSQITGRRLVGRDVEWAFSVEAYL